MFAGCSNIPHKSFNMVSNLKGGRITLTDPQSQQPMPTIFAGEMLNIINTTPYGCMMEMEVRTTHWWSDKESFYCKVKIDATKATPEIVEEVVRIAEEK